MDAEEEADIEPAVVEDDRQDDLRGCAADLLLVEQARGPLLNEND